MYDLTIWAEPSRNKELEKQHNNGQDKKYDFNLKKSVYPDPTPLPKPVKRAKVVVGLERLSPLCMMVRGREGVTTKLDDDQLVSQFEISIDDPTIIQCRW